MQQPQLGNLISKIRKDKRITQEELAEKCTINVRTIQRIESGEVNPRSYTLNIIYSALEYNPQSSERTFDNIYKNLFYPTTSGISNKGQKELLVTAMICGIIWLCLGVFEAYIAASLMDGYHIEDMTFVSFIAISFVSSILFYRGFLYLGLKYKSSALVVGSYFVLILMIAFAIIDSVAFYQGWYTDMGLAVVESVFGGISGVVLGYGIYTLKDKLGDSAKFGGLFEVAAGLSFASVILMLFGVFLMIPAIILEVLVLHKASEQIVDVNGDEID